MIAALRQNWVRTSFGEVVTLINGRAYKQEEMLAKGTPILRIQNLKGGPNWFYSDLELPPEKYCSAGDLLYAWSASFGPYVYDGERAIFHYHIWNVKPTGAIHKKFAFYELLRITDAIKGAAHGVAMPHITKAGMEAWQLDLPPLAEQQRIADKLDTVLARLDACRDRLARIAPLLKRFRQSVLAAATTGRLTEDWRRDHCCIETGAVLLSSLQGDHAQVGGHARGNASEPTEEAHDLDGSTLPSTWAVATMLDVCEPGRPITYGILKPGPELDDGVPYVRVADFPGNRLRLDSIKRTSPEIDEQFKRARLRSGDLLLSIRGSVGRIVEIPEALADANITQDTARLSINKRVNRRYVLLALLDEGTQRRMRAATRGVAVRGVNIGDVRALQLPLPPGPEQAEVVCRVETLFAFAERLEARLTQAHAAVDRLTPSLLAKAFRGELVPQDPADEPAAELLKRLAVQREAAPPRLRRRHTTA